MHDSPRAWFAADSAGGRRLHLLHGPPAGMAVRGCVLAVHAIAEEMNKSRRMVALGARALAAGGWLVLCVDMLGCGDSSGEFGDARWSDWVDDVVAAARLLHEAHPGLPLWIWGQRGGALVAVAALPRLSAPVHLLLWQPATQGKAALQQLLRLKAAAQLADGGGKAILEQARADLAAGRGVDFAGYALSPDVAAGLEQATLAPPPGLPAGEGARMVWLEVSAHSPPEPSPATQALAPRWEAAGWAVQSRAVNGPSYWQTTEIEDAPALVAATVEALGVLGDAAQAASAGGSGWGITPAPEPAGEQARLFGCGTERLLGVLHEADGDLGVVVVVGGPQYRAGSHRQFVQLARALAAAGHPVLRFDVRGMGDSSGALHTFEHIGPDIDAALAELRAAQPQVRRIVLWGLCDGASAALMYAGAANKERPAGLCLVNPWVRSTQSLAQTRVRHYYLQRLRQPSFWRKLLSGGVAAAALAGLARNLSAAWGRGPAMAREGHGQAQPVSFQQRMLAGFEGSGADILVMLSADDHTAREFEAYAQARADWMRALASPRVARVEIADADHTFSATDARVAAEAATLAWLQRAACA